MTLSFPMQRTGSYQCRLPSKSHEFECNAQGRTNVVFHQKATNFNLEATGFWNLGSSSHVVLVLVCCSVLLFLFLLAKKKKYAFGQDWLRLGLTAEALKTRKHMAPFRLASASSQLMPPSQMLFFFRPASNTLQRGLAQPLAWALIFSVKKG